MSVQRLLRSLQIFLLLGFRLRTQPLGYLVLPGLFLDVERPLLLLDHENVGRIRHHSEMVLQGGVNLNGLVHFLPMRGGFPGKLYIGVRGPNHVRVVTVWGGGVLMGAVIIPVGGSPVGLAPWLEWLLITTLAFT
jgi:hypothetical protein